MSINITGVDKVELLKQLWENQTSAGYFIFGGSPPFNYDAANEVINSYIDYFSGLH